MTDHCTEEAALDLADRMTQHWHWRGYPNVMFWVIRLPYACSKDKPAFAVRSNLVNGMPKNVRGAYSVREPSKRPVFKLAA